MFAKCQGNTVASKYLWLQQTIVPCSSSATTNLDNHGGTGPETRCHFTMASVQLAQPWGKAPKV